MFATHPPRPFARLVLAALAALAPSGVARAQTTYTFANASSTWGSTTTNNWGAGVSAYPGASTRGNGGGAATDIAQISNTGTVALNINFGGTGNGVGANNTIGALVYNPATGTTNTWTFGSNAGTAGTLSFTGVALGGNTNVIISNTAAGTGPLSIQPTNGGGTGAMALVLANGANTIVAGAGSGAAYGNAITVSANLNASNGSISVLGGGTTAVNPGTLTLAMTTNSATGGITVGDAAGSNAGRLRFTTATAMPATGSITVNPNSQLLLDTALTFTRTTTINLSGAGTVSDSGALRAAANVTVANTLALSAAATIGVATGSTLTANGQVTGLAALTKSGPGTLTLGANNNGFGGPTTVSAGTLRLANTAGTATGSNAVTVANGGTLGGGTGGASGANAFNDSTQGFTDSPVTVQNGGRLAPGASVGMLSVTGNITLDAGAALAIELGTNNTRPAGPPTDNNTNDRFKSAGNISFGSSLTVNVDGGGQTFNAGQTYDFFVAQAGGTMGAVPGTVTFNASNIAGVVAAPENFSLSTSGAALVLTFQPVPEPGTVLAVFLGGAGAAQWWRRRRFAAPA